MVTVERRTLVDDGMGGTDYEWATHLELNGMLDKLSGDEILASEKISKTSTHVFIIFEIKDIQATDRIVIDDYIYDIKDVDNPMGLNEHMEIMLEYTDRKRDES